MMENSPISRRSLLKGLGGTAAVAGTGGAALFAATGPVAAQNFTISDTSVSLNDGEVSYVAVDVGGDLTWDGFDEPVERIRFISEIRIPGSGNGWHTLSDVTSDTLENWSPEGGNQGWGGSGEWVEYTRDGGCEGRVFTDAQWVVIGESGVSPDGYRTSGIDFPDWTATLSNTSDDSTKDTEVEKRSTVYFKDANENDLDLPSDVQPTQATASFIVSVTNEDSTTGGSSTGSSTAG